MLGLVRRCAAIAGADNPDLELVQIGDLARRVGVRVDTLRAWERRYELLRPSRSTGGFRLYSSADEAIVRSMLAEIERGYPPSQAAKLALARARTRDGAVGSDQPDVDSADPGRLESLRIQLSDALRRYDGARAQEIFDAALAEFTLNAVLRDVVLRCLSDIGDAWARGDMTVAEEHFASQLIRERLLALARDWDRGRGPRALLACPSGERHDIGLICFGIVLSRSGWRITFLGPDTPIDALTGTVAALEPELIVLAASAEEWFVSMTSPLRTLASEHEVLIGGAGATARVAHATGAGVLGLGPVEAALQIAGRDT
jgi:MerR family transcriptional regulator, light-induced transcriptional regulator